MNEEFPKKEKIFTKEEIEEAKKAFEDIAVRLDKYITKENLTDEEQKTVDLLLNNAMVLDDILKGNVPEEMSDQDNKLFGNKTT